MEYFWHSIRSAPSFFLIFFRNTLISLSFDILFYSFWYFTCWENAEIGKKKYFIQRSFNYYSRARPILSLFTEFTAIKYVQKNCHGITELLGKCNITKIKRELNVNQSNKMLNHTNYLPDDIFERTFILRGLLYLVTPKWVFLFQDLIILFLCLTRFNLVW